MKSETETAKTKNKRLAEQHKYNEPVKKWTCDRMWSQKNSDLKKCRPWKVKCSWVITKELRGVSTYLVQTRLTDLQRFPPHSAFICVWTWVCCVTPGNNQCILGRRRSICVESETRGSMTPVSWETKPWSYLNSCSEQTSHFWKTGQWTVALKDSPLPGEHTVYYL